MPTNPIDNPYTVFLCHASEDKDDVQHLYHRLRLHGVCPWLDEENLVPGQVWEEEIQKAVRANQIVLVCLSKRSVRKEGFVQKEIKYALDVADEKPEQTIYIVPVRLDDCTVPARLKKWQWVDLFDPRGFDKLLRAIGVKSLEPRSVFDPDACLLISDRTQFSTDLMALTEEAGFLTRVIYGISMPFGQHGLTRDFGRNNLVLLVRGEHFQGQGNLELYNLRNLEFYNLLKDFVRTGGTVFATPWVSWETHVSGVLDDILPFEHRAGLYSEDAWIKFAHPENGDELEFQAAYEHLGALRANARLLLASETNVPLLGVRESGWGRCFYFNACQHSCREDAFSPLESNPELRQLLKDTFISVHSEAIARSRFRPAQH